MEPQLGLAMLCQLDRDHADCENKVAIMLVYLGIK